jgi:hypothetical protein
MWQLTVKTWPYSIPEKLGRFSAAFFVFFAASARTGIVAAGFWLDAADWFLTVLRHIKKVPPSVDLFEKRHLMMIVYLTVLLIARNKFDLAIFITNPTPLKLDNSES